jgi:hypothetical protein
MTPFNRHDCRLISNPRYRGRLRPVVRLFRNQSDRLSRPFGEPAVQSTLVGRDSDRRGSVFARGGVYHVSLSLPLNSIATIRRHVGGYVYWRERRFYSGATERAGWGKLTRAAGRNLWLEDQFGGEITLYLPNVHSLKLATPRTVSPTWTELRNGQIIGMVDERDAVDSRYVSRDNFSRISHAVLWPTRKNGLWRWDFNAGLTAFVPECAPSSEQWEVITRHITKQYGIEWWENGYHDLDQFLAHLYAEKAVHAKA